MNYNRAIKIARDAFGKLNKAKLYREGNAVLKTESVKYQLPHDMELEICFKFDKHTGMWMRYVELTDSDGCVVDCISDEGIETVSGLANTIFDVFQSIEEEESWEERLDKHYGYPGLHNSFDSKEDCGIYWDAMELTDSIFDVDGYVNIIKLFGYNIGLKAAHDISGALWEREEIDALELGKEDKDMVQDICKELHLEYLDFSNWGK